MGILRAGRCEVKPVIGGRCGACGQFFTITEPLVPERIQTVYHCGKSWVSHVNGIWTGGGMGNFQLVHEGDPI